MGRSVARCCAALQKSKASLSAAAASATARTSDGAAAAAPAANIQRERLTACQLKMGIARERGRK